MREETHYHPVAHRCPQGITMWARVTQEPDDVSCSVCLGIMHGDVERKLGGPLGPDDPLQGKPSA